MVVKIKQAAKKHPSLCCEAINLPFHADIGAHYLLQTRIAVLNNNLHRHFERWYPGLKIEKNVERPALMLKIAA